MQFLKKLHLCQARLLLSRSFGEVQVCEPAADSEEVVRCCEPVADRDDTSEVREPVADLEEVVVPAGREPVADQAVGRKPVADFEVKINYQQKQTRLDY